MTTLKKQAISGLFWTFTQQFSVQAINVIVGIVLARILAPSVFGLIGMLAVFIAVGTSLMDSGMTSSLIRTTRADQKDYSTVFFVNLIFSVIFYLIIFLCGPLIAKFYHQPILSPVVRVYSLAFIIRAFVAVQTTKLTKEMRFKEQMLMQIPSTIIGGLVGVVLAYQGFGVWSLVTMNLLQSLIFTIQHWLFSGWVPSLLIDKSKFKYHFHFGYKLTFSGLIDTIYSNIYKIVIGKYFSATELGYFTQAQSLQMLPVTNISIALSKVTYPMFAALKNDDIKLRNAYRKLLHQVAFIVAPLMAIAIVLAKPLFIFALTAKWLPAVPYFQILCITGVLYPYHAYNLNILNVKGRSDLYLKLEIIKKAFITVGVAVSIFYGIYGLLIFQVISSIFAFIVNTWYSGKFINYPGYKQIIEVTPIILIAGSVGLMTFLLNKYFISDRYFPNIVIILLLTSIYLILYFFLSKIFRISALQELKLLILKQ
ncbi:lipopolysaccharide biosynthesis protein [Arachidicoccus terrestris]|uniref:lipopolysaccharide biosynthesis protein n=1 Tax=Arachidicoccus terrestris TaxID=2875539 RepID=UPI001CC75B5E|nr:lipopolysaccharide biosynthesis protein [Arachidicoccus terrestris]UAY55463.1 lipopolysaccharide biosynthesis protein [Arachidicoccus terrestris]